MSVRKPAFKPGQSGKKASASSASASRATSSASASRVSGKSLAQQIAELSNPTPKNIEDPEDEGFGASAAQVTRGYDDIEDGGEPTLLSERSHIRKNFDIEDVSEEYKGKVVSRKKLQAFGGDDESEDEDAEDEDLEDGEEEDEDAEDGEDAEDDEEGSDDMQDDDDEDQEDQEDASDEEGGGTKSMLASGLSDQQRRVQAQLAALEEQDEEASASLFQPRGAAAAEASLAPASASTQYTKSVHMQNQLAWYTQLLNLRIRVQGVVSCANRLPAAAPIAAVDQSTPADDPESALALRSHFESASAEVAPAYASALRGARRLLDELFELQFELMAQNTHIFAPGSAAIDGDADKDASKRIPRWPGLGKRARDDEDEETEAAAEDEDGDERGIPVGEPLLDAYWSFLSGALTPFFTPLQNALIDRWNTKTQLSAGHVAGSDHNTGSGGGSSAFGRSGLSKDGAAGGLKVINQSVLAQIEQIMLDPDRLIKRAQLNRAAHSTEDGNSNSTFLLGRVAKERERASKRARHGQSSSQADSAEADLLSAQAEEYDGAIYDDNDYYQQLLGEIISAASSAALEGSGVAGGHDAAQLAKAAAAARKKGKKGANMVDRRASKGRKMRYTVHAKLANFMAPQPAPISDDYASRAGATSGSAAALLTGSGFALDELFGNLFGGQAKKVATQPAASAEA